MSVSFTFSTSALHAQVQANPSIPTVQSPVAESNRNVNIGPTPKLVTPSGPFGIGRIGYDWTDPGRLDRNPVDSHTHRELMVYLWYPTSPKRTDVRGAYLPGASQIDASPDAHTRMANDFGANWPLMISGAIYSDNEEGAPAATNGGKGFPVITFSHGAVGTGFGYTSLIEDVVSHGYVVASIEHTGKPLPLSSFTTAEWLYITKTSCRPTSRPQRGSRTWPHRSPMPSMKERLISASSSIA